MNSENSWLRQLFSTRSSEENIQIKTLKRATSNLTIVQRTKERKGDLYTITGLPICLWLKNIVELI